MWNSKAFYFALMATTLLALEVWLAAHASAAPLLLDEFDDGFIAPIYNDVCLSGAVETGGAYSYPGPNLGCFPVFGFFPVAIIEVLEPGLVVPENVIVFEVRLDRVPQILAGQETGELVGIGLNPLADTSLGLNFFLQRFPTGLEAVLFNPSAGLRIQSALVSANPDADAVLAATTTIELRLELGENVANEIFPAGAYRLCQPSTCLDETTPPFVPLDVEPAGIGFDSLALAAAARLTLQGIAQVGVANAFAIERLEVPEPAMAQGCAAGVLASIAFH